MDLKTKTILYFIYLLIGILYAIIFNDVYCNLNKLKTKVGLAYGLLWLIFLPSWMLVEMWRLIKPINK